jgi:hypothetical protein
MQSFRSAHPKLFKAAQAILVSIFLVGLVKVLALSIGTSINDYTLQIRPLTLKWLSGQTRLFDQNSLGYYNLPWSLWLVVPTVWFPPDIGQALLNLLNLAGVGAALAVFGRGVPLWLKVLAALPFYFFMLLVTGNLDGILLLGFCLSWRAIEKSQPCGLALGLWLATLKPINSIPLLLYVVFLTWRWPWTHKAKALSLAGLSLLLSFPIFGWDWLWRYLHNMNALPPLYYPLVTLWKLSEQVGLPLGLPLAVSLGLAGLAGYFIKKYGVNQLTFAHTLAVWMLITPYASDIHYVLLIPAWLTVARYSTGWALLAYAATLLPLLRIPFGFGVVCIDLLYPALIWLSTLFIFRQPEPLRRLDQRAEPAAQLP